MPLSGYFLPMPPHRHRVAILALPSVVPFDLGVPIQVFGYPRPDLGAMRYRAVLCTARAGAVPTAHGFNIDAPFGLGPLRTASTIVIPGIDDTARAISPVVLRALRAAHARGARLVSICTGAFALAAAGLLDGKRATTHWMDADDLARRFPRVRVDPRVLYVDEGRILTSAGIAAGIDLCLHVVRLDHGTAVANAVARRMVVPPHRDGGQAQYIPEPVAHARGDSLERTRDHALAHLRHPWTVAALAHHATLAERTFARRFVAETGTSPGRWLLHHRLQQAQVALETTDRPVERIAQDVGFGSAVTLRQQFQRVLGTSPSAYRRSFADTRSRRGDVPSDAATASWRRGGPHIARSC
jgi:AraC family transcriptional activator FtrA